MKPIVIQQSVQKRQRLRGDKFAADLLAGETVFFQQQHFSAHAGGAHSTSRAGGSRADYDQVILGRFQTITPMRKR